MFELNLIKDKAKARQRRRIIFMSIVCIALLSGLSLIAVGSLYWTETTRLNTVESEIAGVTSTISAVEDEVKDREPVARKTRNGMIRAWQEDYDVIQNRPRLTPVVSDLARYHPRNGDFWYNEIHIRPVRSVGAQGQQVDPSAAAKALMGTRRLEGGGYIEIEQSDVMTDNELRDMTAKMTDMVDLVGVPTFTITDNMESEGLALEGGRYVRFTVSAAATTFAGARGGPAIP
jgi:hypothetical protein